MRKYSINAADGRFLGVFEFNEWQILEWVKSKSSDILMQSGYSGDFT